ncbi:MAG: NADH-quinone oxidoreductase subunit M [Candidatus Parvarchaeota archaeon]|nr:NADH-quinone oxidoreductase subunit M [Candidatus Parvarchaeota archaeon]
MVNLLSLVLVPALGAVAVAINSILPRRIKPEYIAASAFLITSALFFIGVIVGFSGFSIGIINSIDFAFTLQLNGISLPFLLLAVTLPALGLWSAVKEINSGKALFYIFYLLSYASLIGVFISSNLIAFFIFWEIVLISFFFIITFWGEEETRRKAGMKFLIFTQFGSLTLLGAFILLFIYTGSFSLGTISSMISLVPSYISYVIFAFVLITAVIKMPMFPMHSWLPDAHVSAPTAGSVLLAGVLLKLGGYVLILFGSILLSSVMRSIQIPLMLLGVFTVIYSTLAASSQTDFKKMIAYSSIFYMGLVFIGIASLNQIGESGSIFLMVSHGFIVGMLFVLAGILKEKTGTRDLNRLGGLMSKMPLYSVFLVLAVIATLGVPGLSNFVGELLVFIGAYAAYPITLVALAGVLIATNYYLSALKRILYTSLKKTMSGVKDISYADAVQLSIFSIFIIIIGVVPIVITNSFSLTI